MPRYNSDPNTYLTIKPAAQGPQPSHSQGETTSGCDPNAEDRVQEPFSDPTFHNYKNGES